MTTSATTSARILFLVSAHNGLSRRAFAALMDTSATRSSWRWWRTLPRSRTPSPGTGRELIACPMLKTVIPASVWTAHRCLIVHPGPPGDRGPSSLDWAIELGATSWGVTVLEATDELDGGPVWAARSFRLRPASKSSLYRHEVRRAAVEALVEAVGRVLAGEAPTAVDLDDPGVTGRARPAMTQRARAIDWQHDDTAKVLRRIRAADSRPACSTSSAAPPSACSAPTPSRSCAASRARSSPSATERSAARRPTARCGSPTSRPPARSSCPPSARWSWPALADRPGAAVPLHTAPRAPETWREIAYEEDAGVGFLRFDFYNGAMGTDQCRRLLDAFASAPQPAHAGARPARAARDFFSNGIDLNVIEASDDPAAESWRNISRSTTWSARSSRPTRTWSCRRWPATRGRAASRWRSPPTTSSRASDAS